MKFEKSVKIPRGLWGADGVIHTRRNGDKGKSADGRTMPHGHEAAMADFCLGCRKKQCNGKCAAFERELKRRKAEKGAQDGRQMCVLRRADPGRAAGLPGV